MFDNKNWDKVINCEGIDHPYQHDVMHQRKLRRRSVNIS